MSFLKKILKKTSKFCSNKGFNLKKYANKKLAYLEEEELGKGLTPLQQFEAPATTTIDTVDPSITAAMERYIDQNVNSEQILPMANEWVSDVNLRMHFQNLAQKMLGNMSEAFVSRALQSTEISQEEIPQAGETWQSLGEYEVDLVEAFLNSPNAYQTIQSISNSIMQSGYKQGIDKDTAEEISLEAVKIALGAPSARQGGGSLRRDQRFNYFLYNGDRMPPEVYQAYQKFRMENSSSNIDDSIKFLKDNFGEVLIQTLSEQIANEDPSIKQWVLKNSGNVGSKVIERSLGTSLTGGEERGSSLQDTDIEKSNLERIERREKDIRLTEDQKQAIQKRSTAIFAHKYLADVVKDMSEVLSQSIENSYNKFDGKKEYGVERMNMFTRMLVDQYEDLLNSQGKIDAQGDMVFENNNGRIIVPTDTVKDIFAGNMDISDEEIYEVLSQQRKEGMPKFDVLDWFKRQGQSVLTHSSLQQEYKKEFALKTRIKDLYNKGYDEQAILAYALEKADGGEYSNQEIKDKLNRSSNAVGVTDSEEYKRRLTRYIRMTLNPLGDKHYNQLEKYSKQVMKGKGYEEALNSMKPFAQHDVRYMMEGLQDVKQDEAKDYPSDIFQAFMGSLNPHKKVRQDYFPEIYKNLIGKNDEEYQEDTSMLNEPQRQEFLKLEKIKNHYQDSLQSKENAIQKEQDKADNKIASYHNKIKKAYEKHLDLLKKQGFSPISLGDFVGVPNWDGESLLNKEDYVRIVTDRGIKIGKAIDVLWGRDDIEYTYKTMPPLKKIEILRNRETQKARNPETKELILGKDGKPLDANIRQQSVAYIENKIRDIESRLEEFRRINNMSESQYNIASSLCRNYFRKIASIESLASNYQGIKLAEVSVDLDILIKNIEEKFTEDFDSIFRL